MLGVQQLVFNLKYLDVCLALEIFVIVRQIRLYFYLFLKVFTFFAKDLQTIGLQLFVCVLIFFHFQMLDNFFIS